MDGDRAAVALARARTRRSRRARSSNRLSPAITSRSSSRRPARVERRTGCRRSRRAGRRSSVVPSSCTVDVAPARPGCERVALSRVRDDVDLVDARAASVDAVEDPVDDRPAADRQQLLRRPVGQRTKPRRRSRRRAAAPSRRDHRPRERLPRTARAWTPCSVTIAVISAAGRDVEGRVARREARGHLGRGRAPRSGSRAPRRASRGRRSSSARRRRRGCRGSAASTARP